MRKCRGLFLGLLATALLSGVLPRVAVADTFPVVADATSAAFTYLGASGADWLGVQLATGGTATFKVRSTTTVRARVWAQGQTYSVSVDGHAQGKRTAPNCNCFQRVPVADGMTTAQHAVVFRNIATQPLAVRSWFIDGGGRFMLGVVPATGVAGTVKSGARLSFYVKNAANIAMDAVASGARMRVVLDDQWTGYTFTMADTGTITRTVLAWGLTKGLHKVSLVVLSGTLDLRRVWLYQAWGLGNASMVDPESAQAAPLLTVYGDSITVGQTSLGFQQDSDGYPDRLAALRGWRLSNQAVRGASAACYGVNHVQSVIATAPDLVILSLGVNDMIPGPDTCDPGIEDFRSAMDWIVSSLQTGLPDVPIYLGAIIPTMQVDEATRAQWNLVIDDVAAAHDLTVVDPSAALDSRHDYVDTLHPNNRGHAHMAAAWDAAIPA
jgi:lysophospholipase L1-like esterase